MRALISILLSLVCGSALALPLNTTNEIYMQPSTNDNSTMIALWAGPYQTAPFLDFWIGKTNVFQVSSNGVVTVSSGAVSSTSTNQFTPSASGSGYTNTNAFDVHGTIYAATGQNYTNFANGGAVVQIITNAATHFQTFIWLHPGDSIQGAAAAGINGTLVP